MTQAERTARYYAAHPEQLAAVYARHRVYKRRRYVTEHPGAPAKPHWREQELEQLRRLAPTSTAREIAGQLGRTVGSVQGRALRDGIRFASPTTNTAIGKVGEELAMRLLPGAERMGYHDPYDVAWRGQRIDVKTARRRLVNGVRYWNFTIRRGNGEAFLCIGLSPDGSIDDVWLIPQSAPGDRRCFAIAETTDRYADFRLGFVR